jgi:hypothetical protein
MKSYFAKLAARVTLAHRQVSLPVTGPKPVAPFAETSSLVTAATNHVEQYDRPRARANQTRIPQSLSLGEEVGSRIQPAARTVFEARSQSVERPDVSVTTEQSPASITLSPDPQVRTTRSETQSVDDDHAREPDHLVFQENSVTMLTPRDVTDAQEDVEGDVDSDRPTETDQSVLLRKMDAFMESMFRRRSEPEVERDIEQEIEGPRPKSQSVPEAPMRLQPLPRSPQVVEPAEEQSSLVIEKLTVEVVPPAPPPVQSQRQVVVVREARGERRVVPSSRRFGLSQF